MLLYDPDCGKNTATITRKCDGPWEKVCTSRFIVEQEPPTPPGMELKGIDCEEIVPEPRRWDCLRRLLGITDERSPYFELRYRYVQQPPQWPFTYWVRQ